MTELLTVLKDAEQDFEWYPTTNQIIAAMVDDIKVVTTENYRRHYDRTSCEKVLDIGAGNGKVLLALRAAEIGVQELYAIEKSPILSGQLPSDIFVVGTALEEQSLLSKEVDLIFCNPPYSQFEQWAVRIIREAPAPLVYLVIPVRWQDSVPIADALKFRDAKSTAVGSFDFTAAEDRRARARVDLVRVQLSNSKDDAFERFFNEQFADLRAKFPKTTEKSSDGDRIFEEKKVDPRFASLVVGESYPEAMVSLYTQEMANIQKNYELVSELDWKLLAEFDISPSKIMACLKQRLAGLRNDYWREIFTRMSAITDRLTGKKRDGLLATLHRHVHVDFTVDNIRAVIIWVIKNANQYLDAQLIETFELMVDKANVRLYESNKRPLVWDRWRYNESEARSTHFALEYRMVMHSVGGIETNWGDPRLDERACVFLGDLLTVARNLGFPCHTTDNRIYYHSRKGWRSNQLETFYYLKPATRPRFSMKALPPERDILFEVRAFKNRNLHIRLNQRFALALNVEYGRLKGWLRSGDEAAQELGEQEAKACFRSNHSLPLTGNPTLLLAA